MMLLALVTCVATIRAGNRPGVSGVSEWGKSAGVSSHTNGPGDRSICQHVINVLRIW